MNKTASYCNHMIMADPDFISTGYNYSGVSELSVGDSFSYSNLTAGGMVDIRNEKRFNQKILPNHNWRGTASVFYSFPRIYDSATISAGFKHESAHPTMGLNDGSDSAYEKIYDGTWRNVNMNSPILRINFDFNGFTASGEFQYYIFSRDTPELPNNDLASSQGISGGIEYRHGLFAGIDLYLSIFDRYIFQGRKTVAANIYCDTPSGVELRSMKYPVINDMNTISARSGIILSNIIPGRKLSLYVGYIYGNIYGFVDSREKRQLFSAGIEIFH